VPAMGVLHVAMRHRFLYLGAPSIKDLPNSFMLYLGRRK
jgi:hypothetical protein